MYRYEPYQDRPAMGTSTVEMVVDAMDLGGDDPDMLSDFGETDSDEDEFLIPGGRGGGGESINTDNNKKSCLTSNNIHKVKSTGFLGELYTKTALSINLAKTGKRLAYP